MNQEISDFVGVAIHCAIGSSFCTPANNAAPDSLSDELGGYNNYQALFDLKYNCARAGRDY